jgi:hypothetical protein
VASTTARAATRCLNAMGLWLNAHLDPDWSEWCSVRFVADKRGQPQPDIHVRDEWEDRRAERRAALTVTEARRALDRLIARW